MRMKHKIKKIMKALSTDKWVKASEIEEETELSAHEIGGIIGHYMINMVHHRNARGGKIHEYMRRKGIIFNE